uniref:Uncharacterized protein n=1 Tax=Helianthus annuus TaxID=4232 RepID=A0A251VQP8_HELAN
MTKKYMPNGSHVSFFPFKFSFAFSPHPLGSSLFPSLFIPFLYLFERFDDPILVLKKFIKSMEREDQGDMQVEEQKAQLYTVNHLPLKTGIIKLLHQIEEAKKMAIILLP